MIGAALAASLTDFSPSRPEVFFFLLEFRITYEFNFQIFLEKKLMPRLIYIMQESGDPSLRLSALWAVKNVLRKTSMETKRDNESFRMYKNRLSVSTEFDGMRGWDCNGV